ncbi:hypothetical protein FA15DRAFT_656276 [Coprinopsis marcescibilis]|uniref:C2H2-type domain-containing protein n=1 Tax=Coprinopsis marcescibilis TaxID=230819 RepID=A0A5C3KUB4_COPMA|nr:hypothetical protein FA15DRAFT_656276 [Coprinopsis marcescibilis]
MPPTRQPKKFTSARCQVASYKADLKSESDQESQLSCSLCDKTFTRPRDTDRHIKAVHYNENRWHTSEFKYCTTKGCAFRTCDPSSLNRHRKRQHGFIPTPRAPRNSTVLVKQEEEEIKLTKEDIKQVETKPIKKESVISYYMKNKRASITITSDNATSTPQRNTPIATLCPTLETGLIQLCDEDFLPESPLDARPILKKSQSTTPEPAFSAAFNSYDAPTTVNHLLDWAPTDNCDQGAAPLDLSTSFADQTLLTHGTCAEQDISLPKIYPTDFDHYLNFGYVCSQDQIVAAENDLSSWGYPIDIPSMWDDQYWAQHLPTTEFTEESLNLYNQTYSPPFYSS